MQGAEADVVFNVVYTPRTFRYLRWFVASLVEHSDARFRLVANGCGEDEVGQMRELAQRLPDQIAGVVILTGPKTMGHGDALNELFERHDDGRYFAFVDSDMKANGPYLEQLLTPFPPAAAVSSGLPGWSGTNVLPENATGVGGNTILGRDGFVYGSSYLAVYDRAAVAQQRARRGIGFEQRRGR